MRTGVLLLDDVVVVHHEPRPDGSRQMPEVGIVIPAHACALGKALLAFTPDAEDAVLADRGAAEHDRRHRDRRRRAARSAGHRPGDRHRHRGRGGGARRVRPRGTVGGAGGEVVGAVGLVVPTTDWPLPASSVDALRSAARAVSREMGATAWPPPAPTSLGASA